jgi:NAD(P)-dependent dehydrogenase (short-subunit alcohol dehydrogenase family)
MTTKNKIVLVTGGSRGLGKSMCHHLAEKGLDVILTYNTRKEDALHCVREIEKSGQKAASMQLDTGNLKSFDGFFSDLKKILKDKFQTDKIDFLVNNAGIGVHALFSATTEEQFDQLQLIHFKGPFFFTQKSLDLIANGGGIINISSGLARFSFVGYSAYASMKGAMETLTRYQAKELGERGIRVNIVAPGAIETDFGGGRVRDDKELNKIVSSMTALGRAGLPDDIGSVVAFLCTDDAKWINAQRIEVSGGMLA